MKTSTLTQAELNKTMGETEKREVNDLIKKLDSTTLTAFLLWAEAAVAGETTRAATDKAVAFLRSKHGYEKAAQAMLEMGV